MGKGGSSNKKCEQYLNNRTRIKNKTHKLEVLLSKITKEESREAVKKASPIGRKREGTVREKKRKNIIEIKFHPAQADCHHLDKENSIQKTGYKVYYCKTIKSFVNIKQCKSCKTQARG